MPEGKSGRALSLRVIPWHSPQTEEEARKTVSQGSRRVSAGHESLYERGHLVQVASTSLSISVFVGSLRESWFNPRSALSVCRVAELSESPHHLNFVSNLSVRDRMWSAMNGTPKSS
jgi:hypothetical protein